jgi:hypothetical protein
MFFDMLYDIQFFKAGKLLVSRQNLLTDIDILFDQKNKFESADANTGAYEPDEIPSAL